MTQIISCPHGPSLQRIQRQKRDDLLAQREACRAAYILGNSQYLKGNAPEREGLPTPHPLAGTLPIPQ